MTSIIEFKTGNILAEPVDAIVNPVNCAGVMSKGLALQFKETWPENFRAYATACARNEVKPGSMFVFDTSREVQRYIVNFPTKRHWRDKSRMSDIDDGLLALVDEVRARDIKSIAIPALGSGLGGLAWNEVRPRIERAFQSLSDLRVVVFEPLEGRDGIRNLT